jgi:hypothetical protein
MRVVLRQLDGVALPSTLNISSGASVAPRGTLELCGGPDKGILDWRGMGRKRQGVQLPR